MPEGEAKERRRDELHSYADLVEVGRTPQGGYDYEVVGKWVSARQ
jgi:hypothetical protein